MSEEPILVLQLQRMGDLVLTFPLLLQLKRRHPDNPVWVVAEPQFFKPLMPLAPEVTFFPPAHISQLSRIRYKLAVNLSSRGEAADCMGRLSAEAALGQISRSNGLHILGFWQLYRASLTQNNRHNAFHWADLYRLDLEPRVQAARTGHAHPRPAGRGRVGIVLGASEQAKRPDARFWARLAQRLVRSGVMPFFLGGIAEKELGLEVGRLAHLPDANLCGRLPLDEVAALFRELDLCITPDTGPMHLADWLGTPVLNLSMGPVNALETGPVSPGQWILRANMSCAGCWQCRHARSIPCRQAFSPAAVERAALAVLEGSVPSLTEGALPGLALHRTGRDSLGLYRLEQAYPAKEFPKGRDLLDAFWQGVFLFLYDPSFAPVVKQRRDSLASALPPLASLLYEKITRLRDACAGMKAGAVLPEAFWKRSSPCVRLFAGHTHMFLQNADYSRAGRRTALERLEHVCEILAGKGEEPDATKKTQSETFRA